MPHATRPGDVLGDRYRLVDLLTESDGGRFWRAYDRVLERHVAIHVIRGDDERAPALMEAARRSATVLDRRVLRVLDAESPTRSATSSTSGAGAPRSTSWWPATAPSARGARPGWSPRSPTRWPRPTPPASRTAGSTRRTSWSTAPAASASSGCASTPRCTASTTRRGRRPARPRRPRRPALLRPHHPLGRPLGLAGRRRARASHGEVLRPRQVRAGIPRPLDLLCEEVLHRAGDGRGRRARRRRHLGPRGRRLPRRVRRRPDRHARALLAATPDVLPDEEQVVLPPVPEMRHAPTSPTADEPDAGAGARARARAGARGRGPAHRGRRPDLRRGRRRLLARAPYDAGPTPPPFEAPPERPLFAPEPAGGTPSRARARPAAAPARPARTTASGPGTPAPGTGTGQRLGQRARPWRRPDETVPGPHVPAPGRGAGGARAHRRRPSSWRSTSAAATTGGPATDDPTSAGTERRAAGPPGAGRGGRRASSRRRSTRRADPRPRTTPTRPLAVDGDPATTWSTEGYTDQLGPPPGSRPASAWCSTSASEVTVAQVVAVLRRHPHLGLLYVADGAPTPSTASSPVARAAPTGRGWSLDAGGAAAPTSWCG